MTNRDPSRPNLWIVPDDSEETTIIWGGLAHYGPDSYIGHYPDLLALGRDMLTKMGMPARVQSARQVLPEAVRAYLVFDVGRWVQDADASGEFHTHDRPDGSVLAFHNYQHRDRMRFSKGVDNC